ncbi:MAG: branched-chain amino acid transporter permease [Rhizobacter sp.]|nr:branched-chain amino acid transporter permease [Rhizobacter sp.]
MTIFGVAHQALIAQMMVGLVNGSFYAVLSLGLAVIFGMLGVVNFVHGALYMLGAVVAWWLSVNLGFGYWASLFVAPAIVGLAGAAVEFTLLRRLYRIDPVYGMLLTLGLAYVIEGLGRFWLGASGMPFAMPDSLKGSMDLGVMRMPIYRGWVIVASLAVCLATWFAIERTRLGAYLRAATENPGMTRAFGVNVPLMVTATYAFGVALAAFAGVLAAPIYQVSPIMGSNLVVVVFAVVVIGGMGSIMGAIVTGLLLGLLEGLARVYWPEASSSVVFLAMIVVLLTRPSGLFGR